MMDGLGPRHNEAHIGLHSNSWGDCEPNTHVNAQPATPNWTTQFVTFAARWTAERVDFYVNDQFVFGWALTGGLARINQCAHNIAIKSACGGWHVDPLGGTGCTARSPDEIVSQFDWVRVWQKTRVGNGTYGLNP